MTAYVCKRCGGPAPTGVGYVARGSGKASAALSRCACGYSVKETAK